MTLFEKFHTFVSKASEETVTEPRLMTHLTKSGLPSLVNNELIIPKPKEIGEVDWPSFTDLIGEVCIGKAVKEAITIALDTELGNRRNRIPPWFGRVTGEKVIDVVVDFCIGKRIDHIESEDERRDRITKLADFLTRKLSTCVDSLSEAVFFQTTKEEAAYLKLQNPGVDFLHWIGSVYVAKAKEYSGDFLSGLTSLAYKMKKKSQSYGKCIEMCYSAVGVTRTINVLYDSRKLRVFWPLFQDFQMGRLADILETETGTALVGATRKVVKIAWHGCRQEIENVLRAVCERVMGSPYIDAMERRRRAATLKIMGEIYKNVKLDDDDTSNYEL